jgi:phage/plasmid-like protein (TIGR03299 family)
MTSVNTTAGLHTFNFKEIKMAHLVESMAYVNQTPWHGLGNQLSKKQSIEVWAQQAGMAFDIKESPVRFMTESAGSLGAIMTFPEQKVLYRSDTKTALSVVSNKYQVVQPREILEFYRDLTEISGFELETAGVLKEGRKVWALAKTNQSTTLKGNDVINAYLLLATACDGSLATTAQFTSVRVVCNNTLAVALNNSSNAVKVPHNTNFDAQAVKRQLGISVASWDAFMYRMKTLSERKVKSHEAMNYFLKVFTDPSTTATGLSNERAIKKVQELYDGRGKGAELSSSKDTAFGLLNSITEYVDHEKRSKTVDHRLESAWFGQGATLKQKALDQALLMIA